MHAGSRYGSNASIETFSVGSASAPHNSRAVEHDRVEPLRIVALADARRVGKHVAAVDALDHADLAARVARQPRVRRRMDVLGAHAVARLEARPAPAPAARTSRAS